MMLPLLFAAQLMNCGVQTLVPTMDAEDVSGLGSIVDPENSYDQDEDTYSLVKAPSPGNKASLILNVFGNDCNANNRGSVVLRVKLESQVFDSGDRAYVYFRANPLDVFSLIGTFGVDDIPLGSATNKYFDITTLAGINESPGFGVAVTAANSIEWIPDPPSES